MKSTGSHVRAAQCAIACLLATSAWAAQAQSHRVVGDGVLRTEVRELPAFTALSENGAFTINAQSSSSAQLVQISGDENIVPLITTDVVNGKLVLGVKKGYSLQPKLEMKADLQAATLKSIKSAGASNFTVTGLTGPSFNLLISGSSGASLSGQVTEAKLQVSGAGTINGRALVASNGVATISGTGNITINATDTLNASIPGSGTISYLGNPVVTQHITGVGSVVSIK